jgi:hypothetical protein
MTNRAATMSSEEGLYRDSFHLEPRKGEECIRKEEDETTKISLVLREYEKSWVQTLLLPSLTLLLITTWSGGLSTAQGLPQSSGRVASVVDGGEIEQSEDGIGACMGSEVEWRGYERRRRR